MPVARLSFAGFRNLAPESLDLAPGLTLVLGPNGAGKSNLLEAVCVLGNVNSFRPTSPAALVTRGAQGFELHALVDRAGVPVELHHRCVLGHPLQRHLARGSRRLATSEYLLLAPVLAFSSYDRHLVWGPPEARRRFLDRVAFDLQPEAISAMQRYRQSLRQRAALLSTRPADAEIDAFEFDLARVGARIVHLRLRVLSRIEAVLPAELSDLGWSLPMPVLRYHDPAALGIDEVQSLARRLQVALGQSRRVDRHSGSTSVGPHRHDLVMTIDGVASRHSVSAGQGKLLATAIKLAVLRVLTLERGTQPTVVFDDVDAELDARVLRHVLTRLASGQALVSSAHHAMIGPYLDAATVWQVDRGRIEQGGSGG